MFLTLFRINCHCSMNEFQSCFQDVIVSPPSLIPSQIVYASHTHIQESLPLFVFNLTITEHID
ncbi:hypothetical protein Hdeb2414_s0024g00645651 [Helianthus debilis subsp. tardiflorus]